MPAFFALDPIPIGPVPRCRAAHDEVETIPVRVFPGVTCRATSKGLSFPACMFSDKTVRQTHGKNYGQCSQFWRTPVNK